MDSKISLLDSIKALRDPPKVFITLEAITKIKCFVHLASGEINGLGRVEKRKNDLVVVDSFILKQKVSRGDAETDPVALNRFVAEYEDPSKLNFQWHSHVNMRAEFSSTDTDTIKEYPNDFMISLVINKQGEYSCRLDLYKPFYVGFEVPLLVILPVEEKLLKYCQKRMDEEIEEGGIASLKRKAPLIIRKSLNFKDTRFSGWNPEKNPAIISLSSLVDEWGKEGKDEFLKTT